MTVQRYGFDQQNTFVYKPYGQYVDYDDYAALEKKYETLRTAIMILLNTFDEREITDSLYNVREALSEKE